MQPNTTPTIPGHVPAKKSRRWVRPVAFSAAGVLTLFIGVGIGVSGSDAPADAKPAPTKTVTAEPEVITETETVTETVEVSVTPEACITALDLSGDALGLSGDVIGWQSEALGIASDALSNPFAIDEAGIDRIVELTGFIEGASADMEAMTPAASAASSECRGA